MKLDKAGASFDLVDVEVSLDAFVSKARDKVFERMRIALKEVDPSQVKLFLSSKPGVKASPPDGIGGALEPDETLRFEVLDRLNPTGAGAGAVFPDTLYLVAVVEGACAGGGVVV